MNPGAYVFPYYTQHTEGGTEGQLVVSTTDALATK